MATTHPLSYDRSEALTRNPKFSFSSAERRALYLSAFARVGTITGACTETGISINTVKSWRRRDPQFAQRLEQISENQELILHDTLFSRALNPKDPTGVTAGIFLLKAKNPERYNDRAQLTVDHNITVTAIVQQVPTILEALRSRPLPTTDVEAEYTIASTEEE
jgi:hypothetical protein